jgi:SAM-dependent methyltransferase
MVSNAMSNKDKIHQQIISYWDSVATPYHDTEIGEINASPDILCKELELDALHRALNPDVDTIEIGCGNGHNLFELQKTFTGSLTGLDVSAQMIKSAKTRNADINFITSDILTDLPFEHTFSQAFSVRCLINIHPFENQLHALSQIASLLNMGGVVALIEPTLQSLHQLNELRTTVGLEEIELRWHNLYIDEEQFLDNLPGELELEYIDRFSSTYYLASRIFNAIATPRGESPDYRSAINQAGRLLPSFGDFGPHKMFVLRKVCPT